MARYEYSIIHVAGKYLHTADTLSRSPSTHTGDELRELVEEVEVFIEGVIRTLPATPGRLEKYQQAQASDAVLFRVIQNCYATWPGKRSVDQTLIPYWKVRSSLTLHNGLLLYNGRIVIYTSKEETLRAIHEGHQGIKRCRMRAKSSVWWPNISKSIVEMVSQCAECAREAPRRKEPLITSPLPEFPWQVVGSDLFMLKGLSGLLLPLSRSC